MPKKSDNPSEKVRKTSGYSDNTENALVTTTDTVVKERNTDMVDNKRKIEPNVVKKDITPTIPGKNNTDTVNKTDK